MVKRRMLIKVIRRAKRNRFWASAGPFGHAFGRFSRSRETPLPGKQLPPEQIQVGKREGRVQPRRILGQPSVAHLAEAPKSLDDMEGMLATGPRLRTQPIDPLLMLAERAALRAASVHSITDSSLSGALSVKVAPIRLVAEQLTLFTVQQVRQLRDVRRAAVCRRQAVDDAAPIGADVGLHPEVPVLALLALAHLRISRPL